MARDWTAMRAKVDREGECRLCGSRHGLQAAHIVPRSLGGAQTADGCVPLCPDCHSKIDSHEIDWLHAVSYLEQAEAVRIMGIERARERMLPSAYPSKVAESAMPSAGYR